jgi:hypothetical protein
MNRHDAKVIAATLDAAISQLSLALHEVEARLDVSTLEHFKRSIGLQIGSLSFELLDPIYAEHPDLAPPGGLEQ